MDQILNRICSIDSHPIAELDDKFRIAYVKGLAACMYSVSKGSEITKMITFAWILSIIPTYPDFFQLWKEDIIAIRCAISLKRKGIRFFNMRGAFFYDVFYLAQASLLDKCDLEKISNYLDKEVCRFFSKKTLNRILSAYQQNNSNIKGVSDAQIKHRNVNLNIVSETEKRILVVANVSAGKSTLINALVGYRFNRTKTTACTDKLIYIHNKCSNDGITTRSIGGEYSYSENINDSNSDLLVAAAFPFKSSLKMKRICFIDSPGVNNADDSHHRQVTEKAIKNGDYDAVLYISNCQYFGTNDEHAFLGFLRKNVKKPLLFVLNQLDKFNPDEDSIRKMLNNYKSDLVKFGFKNPVIIPVSAYMSFLLRLEPSCLTKIETIKKNQMIDLFKDDYYDMPSYIGKGKSTEMLDKTGIKALEEEIITL